MGTGSNAHLLFDTFNLKKNLIIRLLLEFGYLKDKRAMNLTRTLLKKNFKVYKPHIPIRPYHLHLNCNLIIANHTQFPGTFPITLE